MFELPSDIAASFADRSFPTALKLASQLGDAPAPLWIGNPKECVRLVELAQVNPIQRFVQGVPADQYEAIFDGAFTEWAENPSSAPGITSARDRKNVVLRLWAGCVWSGKLVAYETRSGVTAPEMRAWFFIDVVAPRTALCQVYKAGVIYAVDWKRSFEPPQAVVLDGVPPGHLVRQRHDAGLVR